jgi:hypothetical protein
MMADVVLATPVVVTVKVALLRPLATVTLDGTVAPGEFELNVTTRPPLGAELLKVTVPCEAVPPVTLVGFSESVRMLPAGGLIVRVAVLVTPAYTAEIVDDVVLATAVVVTVKVALLLPPATVTLAGTVVDDEVSLNDTTRPPLGAGPLKVTVPCELLPPVTLVGFSEIVLNAGGFTVRVAVMVTPALTAEMVADVVLATTVVVTVKVALLAPPATVTLAGTVTPDELELSVTTRPPLGAGPLKVTVPWEVVPPATLVGFSESVFKMLTTCGFTVRVAVLVTPA